MTDELLAIVPPEHKWVNRHNIRAEEMAAETFIFAARGAGARATVEERLKAKGIVLPNMLDFVNIEGVKHAVEAGLGISHSAAGRDSARDRCRYHQGNSAGRHGSGDPVRLHLPQETDSFQRAESFC